MTPDPLPILHVVRPAAGGIRQHVLELLRRTDAARFTLSLAGPPDFLAGLPANLFPGHIHPLDISARLSPWRDLRATAGLVRLLPSPPDRSIVHAHGLRAAFVTALAHCRRPFLFVFTAHNLVPPGRLMRLAIMFIGRQAVRVIAISEAVARELAAAGVPGTKIVVVPNGVDVERFAPPAPKITPRPPILGESEKFTVGCVARLSHEKGVDVLVRAAARLPDVEFLIAGDGPEQGALKRDAPPNVTLTGRVADTRDIYAASDVIAVPSRQEGQGIVALEAMAAGRPLVASRVGGLAEMLTDGETALLIPHNDPAALAAALARLRDDTALRARLAVNGRALVIAQYDVRRMVAAVEEVYTATAPVRGRSS